MTDRILARVSDGPYLTDRQLQFVVNGQEVIVPDRGDSLLGVLRDDLGLTGSKDGCSPQGQCGCCTVVVDGKPRVACVTPARRVAGRSVVTIEGLAEDRRTVWGEALCATGGSQCGFCTPGIVLRLDALLEQEGNDAQHSDRSAGVDQALLAHLCRCTGWQTIHEAVDLVAAQPEQGSRVTIARSLDDASLRASIEGGSDQRVGPDIALGFGGFAADTAPSGALRAVSDGAGGWAVGETLSNARALAGKTQGRRTTVAHTWPIEVPDGAWNAVLRTTWVEPAFLETDASWCEPGGEPSTPLANGGAFGAKTDSPVASAARELADRHGKPVLVLASREDTVTWGPKRPPLAGGVNADGSGIINVRATPGIAEAIASVAPGIEVREIDGIPGPPTSSVLRAAGWAEAVALLAAAKGELGPVQSPTGAVASASIEGAANGLPVIRVEVECGRVLDNATLRSYCIGAAHMAYSWVTSEALTVDEEGTVHDLTIRSFGVVRAVDTPRVEVSIQESDSDPTNGSDAVFAAVAAATWLENKTADRWPVG